MTPKSRTNKRLREAGLNPKKADESLKRRLLSTGALDGRLAIRVNDWVAADCTFDKSSKLMNRMERSRFPS